MRTEWYESDPDAPEPEVGVIVRLNKREQKQLAKILAREGEIILAFWTTINEVSQEIVICQTSTPDWELYFDSLDDVLSSLEAMVIDELNELRRLLLTSYREG